MQLHMWSRKRPLLRGYGNETPLCRKKVLACSSTRLDRCEADGSEGATHLFGLNGLSCPYDTRVNEEATYPVNSKHLSEQISSWADTQYSMTKVMEVFKFRQAPSDIFLDKSVNNKFLEFHQDITEECGADDKQHSWAVIEKQEEIVMYGPYFPNYTNGEHSEDIVIKQTQELLESDAVPEDGKVFVFTVNSPCLARNTDPCMLNLVHKAQEWWRVYGVKTHIGYVRTWGFKGNKETLFRDISYQQVDCLNQTDDYEGFINAAAERTDLKPLCENLYSAAKRLLASGPPNFPLTSVQGQDWKTHFKNMHSISESKPEEEKKVLTQEVNTLIEAAQAQTPEKKGSFQEHLEVGKNFALDYTFSQQVSELLRDQMRLMFRQCWQEMVQDKYAELIREKLTEDFNQCTVELFIKDIDEITKEYLQIGKIRFS